MGSSNSFIFNNMAERVGFKIPIFTQTRMNTGENA